MSKRVVVSVACWSVLAAGCLGGDAGDDAPVRIIPSDEEDMPAGGVELGGLGGEMGGMMPGGMMGEEVDPVFKQWIEMKATLARYDCTCSQDGAWGPIWDQQTCINHWTRFIGGEKTINCQYQALVGTESAKSRFYPYAQCHIENDANLLRCLGVDVCPSSGNLVNECLYVWGELRTSCDRNYLDVDSVVMNSCRDISDHPLISALILIKSYGFGVVLSSDIIHPFGLDKDPVNWLGSCNVNRCNNMAISFRGDGYYRYYAFSNGDEYRGDGFYGLDNDGKIYFTENCRDKASMNIIFAFQKAWFKGLPLKARGALTDFGINYINGERPDGDICNE